MNSDQLSGKWKQAKGSAKEKWGKLTDDDLDVINGQTDQLVGKVQERYGIAREAAQKQVDEWKSTALRQLDSQHRTTSQDADTEQKSVKSQKPGMDDSEGEEQRTGVDADHVSEKRKKAS